MWSRRSSSARHRPGVSLYQDFRNALQAFPKERLVHSVVPLGRLIFSRTDVLEQLARLDADTTLVMCGEQDKPRPPVESRGNGRPDRLRTDVDSRRRAYLQPGEPGLRQRSAADLPRKPRLIALPFDAAAACWRSKAEMPRPSP